MGKKSANKKKQHGQRPQQKAVNNQMPSQPMAMRKEMNLQSLDGEYVAQPVVTPATPTKPLALSEQSAYVRGDIFRITVLLVIVILLMIVGVIVNNSTSVLHTAGQHLSHFLRLQ